MHSRRRWWWQKIPPSLLVGSVVLVVAMLLLWAAYRFHKDNQREAALQAYIDHISKLLLAQNLRHATEDEEVRKIARVRTLTLLRRLDAERKGSVLQFLHESTLLGKEEPIIDLTGADLSRAHLSRAVVTPEQVTPTRSLQGTIMPDGSKHP
jgi:hypothetical protein